MSYIPLHTLAVALFVGIMISFWFSMLWVLVRNAPTLRSRRFTVHDIFFGIQYFALFCVSFGAIVGSTTCLIPRSYFQKGYSGIMPFVMFAVILILSAAILVPIQRKNFKKRCAIIENDLGLPGERVESYSYQQVERRFFLSIITNILLAMTIFAVFCGIGIFEGEIYGEIYMSRNFLSLFTTLGIIVLVGATYYLFGRHLLKICRTQENFLAAPPLVDKPFETALMKFGRAPASIDHVKKTGKMLLPLIFLWIVLAGFGVWYLSWFSWDKYPISLGICSVLLFAFFPATSLLGKWAARGTATNPQRACWLNILPMFGLIALLYTMEYIEFGGIDLGAAFAPPNDRPENWIIPHMNRLMLFVMVLQIPMQYFMWRKTKREKLADQKTGDTGKSREELLREAIEQYVHHENIPQEENESAPAPFLKKWLYGIGLYAALLVATLCVIILVPNPYAHKKALERAENFTALIELEPNNPEWYLSRAGKARLERDMDRIPVVENRKERLAQILADIETAMRLAPNDDRAYGQRAGYYRDLSYGRQAVPGGESEVYLQQALKDINEALRLRRTSTKSDYKERDIYYYLLNRASIYSSLGDNELAEQDYAEAIRMFPTSSSYNHRAGFYRFTLKDYPRALGDYTTALRLAEEEKARQRFSEYPIEMIRREIGELLKQMKEAESQ